MPLADILTKAGLTHRAWRYRRRVDPDEIRWMCSSLREGDCAIDLGAYKGGYVHAMRRAVGPRGTVVAFEPQPELAAYLSDCVRVFGWTNVAVVERALSSTPGEATLWRPADDPSPSASLVGASLPPAPRGRRVDVDTLDGALEALGVEAPVRFLKIDVEGHELDVLRGGERTLHLHRPRLLVECEQRHLSGHRVEDVFAHLEARGYRGFFFWQGARVTVEDFDAARHQVQGRRPYANNFAFLPAEDTPP